MPVTLVLAVVIGLLILKDALQERELNQCRRRLEKLETTVATLQGRIDGMAGATLQAARTKGLATPKTGTAMDAAPLHQRFNNTSSSH